jgi:pullulanase
VGHLIKLFRHVGMIGMAFLVPVSAAQAAPSVVTVTGNLQSEAGCVADWQPGCANTAMTKSANDGIWRATFGVEAGSFEYKATYDGNFDVNYGLHAEPDGLNIPLTLGLGRPVTFYYDEQSHWMTDNIGSSILVLAANFQSELGCAGDWQQDCMRSWLKDIDGDGIYTFETDLPLGAYETVVTLNESFDISYHAAGGGNYLFEAIGNPIKFSFDTRTLVLTIDNGAIVPPSGTVPEPSTWAMMIGGFALVGGALRRRVRVVRFA